MKCQKCGNIATTHFIQDINGQTEELWLCSDCAEELGIGGMFSGFEGFGAFDPFDMFGKFDMFDKLLSGMIGNSPLSLGGRSAVKAPDRCPLCGSTFDDIVKRGKAGCPECYEHFAGQLSASIEQLHGTDHHTGVMSGDGRQEGLLSGGRGRRGSVVQPALETGPSGSELASLRAQLEQAVAVEDYEKAAELHKKIKELEG